MCCPLRTHTKVISILCLIFTALGALNLISTIGAFLAGTTSTADANLFFGGDMNVSLAVQILIYVFCIVSEVLCLVGAMKNNKCLLVPFIIEMSLTILALAFIAILFIYWGAVAGSALVGSTDNRDVHNVVGTLGTFMLFLLLIPIFIAIGLSIYFLVIVVKYFQEISSGVVSGQSEGIVLQPYSSHPMAPNAGVATVYVPPGGQNPPYGYQQQPPAYQQQPASNPGMKYPV